MQEVDLVNVITNYENYYLSTDKTARDGTSIIKFEKKEQLLNFEGELGALPSQRGWVGFAIVRFPVSLSEGVKNILFNTSSNTPWIKFRITITTVDTPAQYSYFYEFLAPKCPVSESICLQLNKFKGNYRGNSADLPPLCSQKINEIGIEVTRSSQDESVKGTHPEMINFHLQVW